ncbi:MAG: DUF3048 domain-containing protein [Clostridium sp.]|nr:DUF3048 domain-containing protein [Clostridium sp.]
MRKRISKKTTALFLAMTMAAALMTGCGKKEDTPPEDSTPNIVIPSDPELDDEPAPDDNGVSDTEPEEPVEEEVREGMYRSELTNEWIDEELKDQRPVAIMVDNESIALPHYGLTEADIVYEIMNSTANNRVTRLMAVVKDWGAIEQFGSIRSTRQTNIMLAAEWNAVLCHDGGPFYIDEWIARNYSANFSGGFTRVNNGKAYEFTEYICAGDLEERFSNSRYTTEYNDYYPGPHYQFSNTELDLSGNDDAFACTEVDLSSVFPHNSSKLVYNEETGTYDYFEYGEPHLDPQHDDAQLTFKNLLLQDTTFSQLDPNGYLIYNAIDTSKRSAYYITNGQAVEVVWTKESESAPTRYFDKQTGEEIELNTGKTYVALVPSDSWNKIELQ